MLKRESKTIGSQPSGSLPTGEGDVERDTLQHVQWLGTLIGLVDVF